MKNLFRAKPASGDFAATDSGKGDLKDYGYDFVPRNRNVIIQLAGSDARQGILAPLPNNSEVQAFVARRTVEEERTDAPLPVRLFLDSRVTDIVGMVPRGLEPVVFEAMSRLEESGKPTRIPALVVHTRHGVRLNLLMGSLR